MGAFTIGGGYAMIPLIEDEMVKRDWLSQEEVGDIIILAQSAPGILAINMAIFMGHRLGGLKGSLAAAVGATLPSFVIILAIAIAFTGFKDNVWVMRFFQGIRPVAVALIAVPAVRMIKSGCKNWWTCLIAAATLFLVAFMKLSPVWIILTVIACAAGISSIKENRR